MAQIKISDDLHKRLKGAADAHYRSIGGEIEFMMDFIGGRNGAREDVAGYGVWIPDGHQANKQPKTPPTPKNTDVSDLFNTPPEKKIASEPDGSGVSGELACCVNELQPCKHWVWDVQSGEGYRNTLSGRLMEVE